MRKAPPQHGAAVREELEVARVEEPRARMRRARLTLEFTGGVHSTVPLPLAPSTSASCPATVMLSADRAVASGVAGGSQVCERRGMALLHRRQWRAFHGPHGLHPIFFSILFYMAE